MTILVKHVLLQILIFVNLVMLTKHKSGSLKILAFRNVKKDTLKIYNLILAKNVHLPVKNVVLIVLHALLVFKATN